ncbi:MAG: diguanylate cyclase [Sedimenticola sp.]|nr:diguanylate cyclase [Sedimenticola sp.]
MNKDTLPKELLIALMDHLQDAVFAIRDGHFIFVNKQLTTLFGYPEDELLNRPITDFIYDADREMVMERYRARQRGEKVTSVYDFRINTGDGEVRSVRMRAGILRHANQVISVGSLQDITDRIDTMSALAESRADIQSILNNMPDVFYRTDMNGTITLISPSCEEALGYTAEEMQGQPMARFYCNPEDRVRVLDELRDNDGKAHQVEACMQHRNGSQRWISTNAYIRFGADHQPIGVEGIARDITKIKEREERLAELGRIDELTGLLNRRSFLEGAENQLQIAHRYGRELSVIMIDLDWFKSINDRYGHEAGDQALVYFADACREVFRKTDILGRMGGEEFAILVPETGRTPAREMVNRLQQRLKEQPFRYHEHEIPFTLSAGLASLDSKKQTLSNLLSLADKLLYEAKRQGRDQVVTQTQPDPQTETA